MCPMEVSCARWRPYVPDRTKKANEEEDDDDDDDGELNTKPKEVITNRFLLDVLMRFSSFSCS